RLGQRADRVRGLLDAVTLLGNHVLADRASALGGDSARLDQRLDIGAREIGKLLGDLLALFGQLLAALVGVGEKRLERRERRDGFEAVEKVGVGHGLNPLLRGAGGLARSRTCLAGGTLLGGRVALRLASSRGAGAPRRLRAFLGD